MIIICGKKEDMFPGNCNVFLSSLVFSFLFLRHSFQNFTAFLKIPFMQIFLSILENCLSYFTDKTQAIK